MKKLCEKYNDSTVWSCEDLFAILAVFVIVVVLMLL